MDQILQILIQNGYIDETGAAEIADLAKTESKSVRKQILDSGILDEDSLLAAMSAYQDTEAIDLGSLTIDSSVTDSIPASTARMYNVFPVAADDSSVTLATFDIVDPRISDEMLFTLSKEVRFVFAREKDVMDRISQYYEVQNVRLQPAAVTMRLFQRASLYGLFRVFILLLPTTAAAEAVSIPVLISRAVMLQVSLFLRRTAVLSSL